MLAKDEIIKRIEQNGEEVRKFGVKKLTLIGSFARDEAKENSDIDFLVEFVEGRGLFDDFVHLKQFLEDLFGSEIDIGEEHLLKDEIKPNILQGKKIEARI